MKIYDLGDLTPIENEGTNIEKTYNFYLIDVQEMEFINMKQYETKVYEHFH